MITSLVETPELSNFGHMTTSNIQLKSHDKTLSVTSWGKVMT